MGLANDGTVFSWADGGAAGGFADERLVVEFTPAVPTDEEVARLRDNPQVVLGNVGVMNEMLQALGAEEHPGELLMVRRPWRAVRAGANTLVHGSADDLLRTLTNRMCCAARPVQEINATTREMHRRVLMLINQVDHPELMGTRSLLAGSRLARECDRDLCLLLKKSPLNCYCVA